MQHHNPSDSLESIVLARIARHRADQVDRASLSAGTLMVIAALAAGFVFGLGHADNGQAGARDVESIVLADMARMAPSALLANSR
jgi:hypothetical protein